MKLVPDYKNALRWASVQLALAGAALQAGWLALPDDLKLAFPEWSQSAIALVIFLGVVVGRLWDQGTAE